MAQADDLIPIPTLTDSMAAARTRLKMVADGAQVGSTAKAWTAFRSDLSLMLALPDREALAFMIQNELGRLLQVDDEGDITGLGPASFASADRILSHLKGESSND